jgi:hypothetical protein
MKYKNILKYIFLFVCLSVNISCQNTNSTSILLPSEVTNQPRPAVELNQTSKMLDLSVYEGRSMSKAAVSYIPEAQRNISQCFTNFKELIGLFSDYEQAVLINAAYMNNDATRCFNCNYYVEHLPDIMNKYLSELSASISNRRTEYRKTLACFFSFQKLRPLSSDISAEIENQILQYFEFNSISNKCLADFIYELGQILLYRRRFLCATLNDQQTMGIKNKDGTWKDFMWTRNEADNILQSFLRMTNCNAKSAYILPQTVVNSIAFIAKDPMCKLNIKPLPNINNTPTATSGNIQVPPAVIPTVIAANATTTTASNVSTNTPTPTPTNATNAASVTNASNAANATTNATNTTISTSPNLAPATNTTIIVNSPLPPSRLRLLQENTANTAPTTTNTDIATQPATTESPTSPTTADNAASVTPIAPEEVTELTNRLETNSGSADNIIPTNTVELSATPDVTSTVNENITPTPSTTDTTNTSVTLPVTEQPPTNTDPAATANPANPIPAPTTDTSTTANTANPTPTDTSATSNPANPIPSATTDNNTSNTDSAIIAPVTQPVPAEASTTNTSNETTIGSETASIPNAEPFTDLPVTSPIPNTTMETETLTTEPTPDSSVTTTSDPITIDTEAPSATSAPPTSIVATATQPIPVVTTTNQPSATTPVAQPTTEATTSTNQPSTANIQPTATQPTNATITQPTAEVNAVPQTPTNTTVILPSTPIILETNNTAVNATTIANANVTTPTVETTTPVTTVTAPQTQLPKITVSNLLNFYGNDGDIYGSIHDISEAAVAQNNTIFNNFSQRLNQTIYQEFFCMPKTGAIFLSNIQNNSQILRQFYKLDCDANKNYILQIANGNAVCEACEPPINTNLTFIDGTSQQFTDYYFAAGCLNGKKFNYGTYVDNNGIRFASYQQGLVDLSSRCLTKAINCAGSATNALDCPKNQLNKECSDFLNNECAKTGLYNLIDLYRPKQQTVNIYPPSCDFILKNVEISDPTFVNQCFSWISSKFTLNSFLLNNVALLNLDAQLYTTTGRLLLRFLQETTSGMVLANNDPTENDSTAMIVKKVTIDPSVVDIAGSNPRRVADNTVLAREVSGLNNVTFVNPVVPKTTDTNRISCSMMLIMFITILLY